MPETKECLTCGAELPGDSSAPVCAACMLQHGLADSSVTESLEILPGRTFCGYEIVRKIGIGGMGVVYEAFQKSLRRSVALKMVRAPSMATPKDIARFRQEAEAAARLNHPNIVEVYEIGELEGAPYFTMKFVDGAQSLGSELARGPFEPKKAAELICQTARAVAYAHQRGVIHRDLKPANILLDRDGHPCLVDFGLAKLFGQTPSIGASLMSLSDDGKLMGTPHYMSPEQVRGEDLTTSTDVYSLGVVLYELLTGSPPFKAQSLNDILDEISHVPPKPLISDGKGLPRDLEVICFKCLRKEPKNRYGTADELADDLERWLEQRPIHARPSSKRDRIAKWARRNPAVAVLSPVVAVLATVLIGVFGWLWLREKEKREDTVKIPLSNAQVYRGKTLEPGHRWLAIDELRRASLNLGALTGHPDYEKLRQELQDEALACLSLIDLRPSEEHTDSWEGDPDEVGLVRLSPDFTIYAHVMNDGRVVIRDRRSNSPQLELASPGAKPCVGLRFDPDGGRLATVYEEDDGSFQMIVWDISSEQSIHSGVVNGADAFDFSDDGSLVVLARGNKILISWLGEGGETRELETEFPVSGLRLDRESTMIAARPQTGPGLSLLDFTSGETVAKFESARVLDLEWNPRGRWLAMGCDDGRLIVWDTEADDTSADRELLLWSGGQSAIEHIAWHPRGVLIAGTSSSGKVHLWHVAKGNREVTWSGQGYVDRPQFFQDAAGGSRLGPVLDGPEVSLLEVAEGRIVSHARGHPGRIYGSWWRDYGPASPTVDNGVLDRNRRDPGRIFSTAGNDGVRIWNRRGFEKAFIPEDEARAAIFTEKALVITGKNGFSLRSVKGGGSNIKSTEVRIGLPQRYESGTACYDADYDPVHHRLAVAAGDQVLIYEIDSKTNPPSATRIDSLPAPAHTAFVDFSPDGDWLSAGTDGGSGVRIWKTGSTWQEVKARFPVKGSADVTFYQWLPPTLSGGSPIPGVTVPPAVHCFVTSDKAGYKFYEVGSWKLLHEIKANLGKKLGAICFSPRTPVFGVSEGDKIKVYLFHGFKLLISPEFDSQDPVCFAPEGGIIITADRPDVNTHLHLWDLKLLREELDKLVLDLKLAPFKEEPTPDPIEEVIVEGE